MFSLKETKLDFCDYVLTEQPLGVSSSVLLEKHLDSGALVVKVATETTMPVFADGSQYLQYLIKMQKLGATRKQCVLVIIGDYSEFSAEMSINWQLLGGTCILLKDDKKLAKTLIDLAAFQQSSVDDLLISIPYVSYDIVTTERNQEMMFPFFLQVVSATDNADSLEAMGIQKTKGSKIRNRLGIPESVMIWGTKRHQSTTWG